MSLVRGLARRPRLLAAIAVGALAEAALRVVAPQLKDATALIVSWDVLCLAYVALTATGMAGYGPAEIRLVAAKEDEGRGAILAIVLCASAAAVFAVGIELSQARALKGWAQAAHVAFAFVTLALSWFTVQLVFALHYAHAFYAPEGPGKDAGGLAFPGETAPDYWDFLHFSVVIGVAFQTADVAFTSRPLRRLGTVHSLVAFTFNTVIVALTVNLLAGLF